MAVDRVAIARAWLDARLTAVRLRSRADVRRRQARLWRRLQSVIARTPAIAELAGRPLEDFPISTPAQVRADFGRWNTLGLDDGSVRAAAEAAETGGEGLLPGGLTAGLSTGSSGTRGLFLAGPAERATYVGHALARLLGADAPLRSWRIALCLRADSALYRDVGGAGRVAFEFIGLDVSPEARKARLDAFRPNVLIAPSHVLADLARRLEAPPDWSLRRLFYGAEPMGEGERAWIAGRLGARPDPIYQATEGFLGAPCRLGVLHLNEDVLIIERQAVEGSNRFRPVVTDLRRASQPVVRLLLDDLLEPIETCRCGSPLLAVKGVEGRVEDLWRWGDRVVTPREVEDAMVAALGPERAWSVVASPGQVVIAVDAGMAAAATAAVATLLEGLDPVPMLRVTDPATLSGPKRRRIRWSDV